jgi:hypothetical protein
MPSNKVAGQKCIAIGPAEAVVFLEQMKAFIKRQV